MEYYGNNDWRDYLAHHGIMNQKWGKRHGPPYPLDYGEHSAAEKRGMAEAGVKYRGKEGAVSTEPKKKSLAERFKEKRMERAATKVVENETKRASHVKKEADLRREYEKLLWDHDENKESTNFTRSDIDKYVREIEDTKAAKLSKKQERLEAAFRKKYKDADINSVAGKKIEAARKKLDETRAQALKSAKEYSEYRSDNDKRLAEGKSKAYKDRSIRRAKERDEFRGDFLEAIQNEPWYNNKKKRLREYSKYLDDPYGYWEKGGGN